jgi:UDP-N-acetylglucosamine 2-epimerase (non-hydrolysing)
MNILCVAGARPNFVKIAPLLREMRRYPGIVPTLVHTGQHYDAAMSERFFTDLHIEPPQFNLGVGSGGHAAQTAEVMRRLESILEALRPDVVVVVGDVNSTMAAALTAVKLGLPVAHVEAGLRSFDRTMPEEINRVVTDAIADLLFVTEESGRANLLREGVAPDKIHFVGNVMIDALEAFRPMWERSTVFHQMGLEAHRPYAVLTLHRPSNVDDPVTLMTLLEALEELGRRLPIVFPVHPRAKRQLLGQGHLHWAGAGTAMPLPNRGIFCFEPVGYIDFVALMSQARLVLTDSGGIQEETTVLGVPCLTLRDTTERPVTVTHGTNRVIGTDPDKIRQEAARVFNEPALPTTRPPLWDGRAAGRIVNALLEYGRGDDREPVGGLTSGIQANGGAPSSKIP